VVILELQCNTLQLSGRSEGEYKASLVTASRERAGLANGLGGAGVAQYIGARSTIVGANTDFTVHNAGTWTSRRRGALARELASDFGEGRDRLCRHEGSEGAEDSGENHECFERGHGVWKPKKIGLFPR